MTNLSTNLVVSARNYPGKTALRCGEDTLSFAEFDAAAARVATLLERAGIAPGDRVAVMLPNTAAFAIVFYGILRRGAIAVPMNPLLKAREIEFFLTNTAASALFATPVFAEQARAASDAADARLWLVDDDDLARLTADLPAQAAPVARAGEDTAVILHTSGTTGKPKGAELTHAGLAGNAEVTARTLIQIGPDDVVMGALPLFHVFGLTCGLNASVLVGATLTLVPRFDPRVALEVIARDRVTVFEGVPTMYAAMLGVAGELDAAATASLRVCVSGGASLPVAVLTDFERTFDAVILEGYGLSETSPVASFNHPNRVRKTGSIGTPIEGVRMRVVDGTGAEVPADQPGEIQIAGPNVMKGYWNLPESTAAAIDAAGWFATGDIGRIDTDGYFYIVDRKKDLIIRGGFNVYPREVEEVVYEHPAVAEAAVVGIPHVSLGEEIGAAVTLKPGASADPAEIVAFVKQRVAAYKYPRHIWILDTLPQGPTGKILRRDITIPTFESSNRP
ncbi:MULTISPECIES: long-chain-fatty-acid--CoA ligase [unclassified Rhodococcus (in: high G+C Gram-positive bacteria)]|uniref:long-chain-fatty-acid--CoA ligase n=1 Tax=unclassified Rhodococcus (in: high G+C Gram-positive bacteria) TaxID=192944 RepID=UPI000925BD01|nr:long-chain fatty acid--CoA ligase [Rhodococcus sp. M8]OLL18878.1 long-chain-fatty-acid--CoA ligase [Rhodococcus sp. M8]QPG47568.1 long-chain fatty acid--CoA ligase [Rhodococcus sp. M8]